MGREWQIGDPVDYTSDGWMDAQNWGHSSDDDDEDENTWSGCDFSDSRIKEYGKKAWDLYMDFKDEEALHYINKAIDLDDKHAKNWNIKAIILEGLKRFGESEECYNRSLELSPDNLVYDNKARMLYDWANHMINESKDVGDGLAMLDKAREINLRAMKAIPGENSEENIEKYLRQRDSIDFYINYEKEYQRNLEVMKALHTDELFTIAGRRFCGFDVNLASDMPLRLVREPENEFDRDAIAVYAEGKKIGYVANSDRTRHELTSSASDLKDKIQGTCDGRFMFYLSRYSDVDFLIGRIT